MVGDGYHHCDLPVPKGQSVSRCFTMIMPQHNQKALRVPFLFLFTQTDEMIFTARCTTVQSAVLLSLVVCPSVYDHVTKVTFHLPPTATHPLGEWTLPSHALVLCSSDVSDEVVQ